MAHELKRIKERHKVIIDLVLQGFSNIEVAKKLGRHPQAVGQILQSPLMQAEISRRRESMEKVHDQSVGAVAVRAKEKIEGAAEMAADTMIGLLSSQDGGIQHRSAADILDRVYGKAGDKGRDRKPTIVIEGDVFLNLQQALEESSLKFVESS